MNSSTYSRAIPWRFPAPSLIFITCITCTLYGNQVLAQQVDMNDPGTTVELESTVLYSAIDTASMQPEYNPRGEPQPLVSGINQREHEQIFRTETVETTLAPRQQIEIMANMDQGEVLLYSWQVDGRIYFDFHAHQENVNPDVFIRYNDGDSMVNNGSIIAPYTGEHGWYWANLDSRPVTLKLTVSGYYKNIYRHDL